MNVYCLEILFIWLAWIRCFRIAFFPHGDWFAYLRKGREQLVTRESTHYCNVCPQVVLLQIAFMLRDKNWRMEIDVLREVLREIRLIFLQILCIMSLTQSNFSSLVKRLYCWWTVKWIRCLSWQVSWCNFQASAPKIICSTSHVYSASTNFGKRNFGSLNHT